jgi:hypothetical protein
VAASEPSPRQTLAVFLGASDFPKAPKLAQGPAFYLSAQGFQQYLGSPQGLGLPRNNVCWLFDDTRSPSDQLEDIGAFLEDRSAELKKDGTPPQDLILYYVGHGLFCGAERDYCLAVRKTDDDNEGVTSLRIADLASIIKTQARFLRKLLILDCCFSGAAYKEFQSGPGEVSRVKLKKELPGRGTTLFCAASAADPARAPQGLARTMFSDALIKMLHKGHSFLGSRLSTSELGDLVKDYLRENYGEEWVRPEVHSPDQKEGDIASIPFFPNPAFLELQQKEAEEQAKRDAASAHEAKQQADLEAVKVAQKQREEDRRAEQQADESAEREAAEESAKRRRHAIEHCREEVAERIAAGQLDAAIAILDGLLALYPDSPELQSDSEAAQAALRRQRGQQEARAQEAATQSQALAEFGRDQEEDRFRLRFVKACDCLGAGDALAAVPLLEELLGERPGNSDIENLLDEARRKLTAQPAKSKPKETLLKWLHVNWKWIVPVGCVAILLGVVIRKSETPPLPRIGPPAAQVPPKAETQPLVGTDTATGTVITPPTPPPMANLQSPCERQSGLSASAQLVRSVLCRATAALDLQHPCTARGLLPAAMPENEAQKQALAALSEKIESARPRLRIAIPKRKPPGFRIGLRYDKCDDGEACAAPKLPKDHAKPVVLCPGAVTQ